MKKSVSRKLFAFQLERVRHPIEAANNFIIFPKLWNNVGETTPMLISVLQMHKKKYYENGKLQKMRKIYE